MDKEQLAIERLQDAARLSEHRYKKPLMVTYSGGSWTTAVPSGRLHGSWTASKQR